MVGAQARDEIPLEITLTEQSRLEQVAFNALAELATQPFAGSGTGPLSGCSYCSTYIVLIPCRFKLLFTSGGTVPRFSPARIVLCRCDSME